MPTEDYHDNSSVNVNRLVLTSLPEIGSHIKNFFNGQSEIPLILKEIVSTNISAKLLNIKARNYYR